MKRLVMVALVFILVATSGVALASMLFQARCAEPHGGADWSGPERATIEEALADAEAHDGANPGHRAFLSEREAE